jgi:uncharacterized protein YceK
MKRAILLLLTTLIVTGCASMQTARTRSMEQTLSDAGFQMRAADTPQALAYLDTLPARKMLTRSQNGKAEYAYADPARCTCLYVGTEQQYQQFRKLLAEQATTIEQRRDAATQEAFYGLWGGTWPPPLQ